MSDGGSGRTVAAQARRLRHAIRGLATCDRVIFLGSAALALLFLLPWWELEAAGASSSSSMNGMRGAGLLGFVAACGTSLVGLARMGFIALPADLSGLSRRTAIQLGLAWTALVAGPVSFWGSVGRSPGKTAFFWLALLAALATAGAAVWKFVDEQRAKGA